MKYQLGTALAILLIMLGLTVPGKAQTVTGTVKETSSGKVLPGVNITVKGKKSGTYTNKNGRFTITVSSLQDSLIFSFVGYTSKTIPIDGRRKLTVSLTQNQKSLENLVVIGYGTQSKEDETGSVTSVNADDFNKGAITSPQELFQGKAAGVRVTSNGGAPGSGATVRIRGGSSLAASNDPLYVIDGVPLEGNGVSGMSDPLNTINPNDIQSVSILKGASATAIYGSRASNGVIIITTKKGEKGQPLAVNYTGKLIYQTETNQVDVLSAEQFRQTIQDQFGKSGALVLGDDNTNWQDQIYRDTFSQDHSLSFSGGLSELPYRLSIGFTGNNGILKTSRMRRLTGALNLNPSFFNDKLKVDLSVKGVRVKHRFANSGAIGAAIAFDPTHPVRLSTNAGSTLPFDGYYTWVTNEGIPNNTTAPANPIALLNQTHDNSKDYRSIGNVRFTYQIPHIPDLSAKLNLGYDYSKVGKGSYLVPSDAAFAITGDGAPGTRRDYTQDKRNQLLDFYLTYDHDLNSIDSKLKLTGGYSWEHHYQQGSNYATNYNRADTLVINSNTSYKTEHYIISGFGRLNYTFKKKYLLTATIREDGTSRFSPDNRWGTFPSAAVAWKINKESFLKNSATVSQLKLRFGFGITGQQRINQGNYPYLAQYTYSQPTADYQFGNNFIQTVRPEGYNANLKWEETTTYDIGLDYGFFNNRLSGSFDAYNRITNDLLNVIPVSAGTNFTNQILTNIGQLKVKGLELSITGRPIANENNSLQISFNATHNTNKITKLTTGQNPSYIGVQVGGIAGGTGNTIQINSVGHPRNSFYVYQQVYNKKGKPLEGVYVDRNGDGIINADDKYRYKSPTPDYTLDLSPKFQHKNWDLSFSARADLGNYVYNNVASNHGFYSSMYNSNNVITNAVQNVNQTKFDAAQYHSNYYVENASFIRLDNVTAGYTFNQIGNSRTSMRISATAQNLFIITKYDGLDPEVFGGIDNNLYPRPKTFTLAVSLNF